MAVLIGSTRAKYFVYFGSKKHYGFYTIREAKEYVRELEKRGYPYLMIHIKHKGKTIY